MLLSSALPAVLRAVYFRGTSLYPLTIVGGVRERITCPRRGRGRDCAPASLDWVLLGGPSTSPLDAMISSVPQRRPRSWTGACAECKRPLLVSCLFLALGGPSHADEPVYVQLSDKNATTVHTLTDSEYVELQKSLDVLASSARLGAIHDGDKEEI